MYCSVCGNELADGVALCECGAATDKSEPEGSERGGRFHGEGAPASSQCCYVSYEYARTTVKSDLATVATDCYESLGFGLTGMKESPASGTTALSFRRSRRIRGKAQLAKLQRTVDDLLRSIASMEAEKTRKARIQALVIGSASALVLGVGMCCTMVWRQFFTLGVVVGVAGIAGCVYAFMRYRKVTAAETERVSPRIEGAYDQLAVVCEEAQAILREPCLS